jgi:two-component system, NtrC family, sensor kinase
VQNLLSFSRQRKPERDEVDLRKVLDETLALRDYDLKINNIAVERDLPTEPAVVVADAHQVEQVFLNIINNAVDAILETGRTGKLKIRIGEQNGHVCTSFSDDGAGIKDPKRITAHNNSEGGATIEVRIPAACPTAAVVEEAPKSAPRQHEGAISGRVLLVEEEEAVLDFERDVLAGAGATVVTAQNGGDAKTRLLSEQFDAIILNGKMPDQWGAKESYPWIKQNCPTMERHILYTFSAGVEPSDGRGYLQENNVPYLVRPFEVAELISQARRLLQKALAAGAGES